MTTAIQLAKQLSEAFEGSTRAAVKDGQSVGEEFRKLKDGSPEWMRDVCRAAHDDAAMLPDDWRYNAIEDAASRMSELDDDADPTDAHDEASEFADNVDVYNFDLVKWLGSNLNRGAYVDEAISELGAPEPFDIFRAIGMGQYQERREVWDQLARALVEQAESMTDEAE